MPDYFKKYGYALFDDSRCTFLKFIGELLQTNKRRSKLFLFPAKLYT